MSAVSYNIRLDKELRDEAFSVLDSYGLSPSQAFKLFLKQVAKTKAVPLSFDYQQQPNQQQIEQQEHNLTPTAQAKLLQSINEIDNGEYTQGDLAEFLQWANNA